MKDQQKRHQQYWAVSMILWLALTGAVIQIVAGQNGQQQPKIIRTAPVVVPCLECLKSSGFDLGALLRSSGGAGDGGSEDSVTQGLPGPQDSEGSPQDSEDSPQDSEDSQGQTEEDCGCCCCCEAPPIEENQSTSNDQNPSFSVAMLAPLASVLTSFMSGFGRNGNQAVTIDFDGKPFNGNPSEEPLPESSQTVEPLCDNIANNQSISINKPSPSPVPSETPGPPQPPNQQLQENRHPFSGCQCYRKRKKGVSDIEEDSLYAFGQSSNKKCSCNSRYVNQQTNLNQAFSQRNSPDGSNQQQSQQFGNADLNHQSVQRDNNLIQNQQFGNPDFHRQSISRDNNLIQPPSTGNPEFDSISRLSALFSSQNRNLNIKSSTHEQNMMPCQCCC